MWCLEIDQRPLQKALNNSIFRETWSQYVLEILDSINQKGSWSTSKTKVKVLWGDARKKLMLVPKKIKFDLIFHDAFSPIKCPQLWTEEFIKNLADKLSPNGRIITYCSSAAVRGSLKSAGLELQSIIPVHNKKERWSSGTIAIQPSLCKGPTNSSKYSKPLSPREETHLLTSAAIPYRDPKGIDSPQAIIKRRASEQQKCNLPSSSSWKKYWEKTQSS